MSELCKGVDVCVEEHTEGLLPADVVVCPSFHSAGRDGASTELRLEFSGDSGEEPVCSSAVEVAAAVSRTPYA
jgi:hypothetical protein